MAESREIHEFPINILQEMISVLLINKDDFDGEGKVNDYYLLKKGNFATVIYDDTKVSYIANFVGDEEGNWFFIRDIIVDQSLTARITDKDIDTFKELFEELAKREQEEIEEHKKETEGAIKIEKDSTETDSGEKEE